MVASEKLEILAAISDLRKIYIQQRGDVIESGSQDCINYYNGAIAAIDQIISNKAWKHDQDF